MGRKQSMLFYKDMSYFLPNNRADAPHLHANGTKDILEELPAGTLPLWGRRRW